MILAKPLKRNELRVKAVPKFDTGPEPISNRYSTDIKPISNRIETTPKVTEIKGKIFTKTVLLTVYLSSLIDAWEVNQLIKEYAKRKNLVYRYSDSDTAERLKSLVDSGLLDRIKIGKSYRYFIRFSNWSEVQLKIKERIK